MPIGNDKTVCLLSIATSSPILAQFVRTVPEMNFVMEVLAVFLAYRPGELGRRRRRADLHGS